MYVKKQKAISCGHKRIFRYISLLTELLYGGGKNCNDKSQKIQGICDT